MWGNLHQGIINAGVTLPYSTQNIFWEMCRPKHGFRSLRIPGVTPQPLRDFEELNLPGLDEFV